MYRRESIIIAVALVAALVAVPAVEAQDKLGWHSPNTIGKVLEVARSKDVPVVILYQDTDDWGWGTRKFEAMKLDGLVKVRAYVGNSVREVDALWHQVTDIWIPALLFTDGDGHLIAFTNTDYNSRHWYQAAAQARSVMKWKGSARSALEKARKIHENNLAKALAMVEEVHSQDEAMSRKVRGSYKYRVNTYRNTMRPGEKLTEEQRERIRQKQKEEKYWFFLYDYEELREDLVGKARSRIDTSKNLLADGKPRQAKEVFDTLRGCKIDKETDAEIEQLDKEIIAALKAAVQEDKAEEQAQTAVQAEPESDDAADETGDGKADEADSTDEG